MSANKNASEKGMSIFLDVFRRADKNDDGFISWEEFVAYFADGVMGKEELRKIFDEIDTHQTNNIDTEELCSYFANHLGAFKNIYGDLEDLTSKVTAVLFSTSKTYEGSSRTAKFVTRFLMREIQNQTFAIQIPLEAATEELDAQARSQSADIVPVVVEPMNKKAGAIIPGRIVRRAKRQVSSQGTGAEAVENEDGFMNPSLALQVDRLETLVDTLENKVNFDNFVDEEVVTVPEDLILMIHRDFNVKAETYIVENFRLSIKAYVTAIQGVGGCLNVSVRSYPDFGRFVLYEIWASQADKNRCMDSEASRAFEGKADQLATPEVSNSMQVPASWWRRSQ